MAEATITQGTVLIVEDDDTLVTNGQSSPETAALPPIDDGSGTTVAVGYEIRLECTAGGVLRVETDDGRLVGIVPGRGQAIVVAEAGADESETDFWRFQVLAQAPAAFVGDATSTDTEVEVNALRDVLVGAGLMKAE